MSSPVSPSSPSAPPSRPGLPQKYPAWAYVAAVVFVIAILVSPRFRAFVFDDQKAQDPAAVQKDSPSPPRSGPRPNEVAAADPSGDDVGPVTETDAPAAPASLQAPSGPRSRSQKPTVPKTSSGESTSPSDVPGKTAASSPAAPAAPKNGKPAPGKPPAGPKLGELTEVRKGVWKSTAGLVYSRGSVDGHRLDHVMQHARDNKEKPVHGVFLGNREEILAVIDEGYQIALKRGPPTVKKEEEGDRTVYLVDMKRKIGYLGGQVGDRKNHPPCRLLQLVLEENDVITAFPTDR